MGIALFVYLLLLGGWLGAMVFFSFFTAPALFARLEVREAGLVVAMLFPRYYVIGYVCGAGSLALAIAFAWRRLTPAQTLWWAAVAALAAALAVTLYAGLSLRPRIEELRGATGGAISAATQTKQAFARLHRLSVALNGSVLLLDLLALAASAGALARRG